MPTQALALASAQPAREVSAASGDGPAGLSLDDPLLLVYTSGTTGRPKGALLTHANCFWTNLGFDLVAGLGDEDVVLQVLPQFHCGGWNVQPLLAWWKGARVVLERSFEAGRCLTLIEHKRVTTMMGVPAVYQFMAEDPAFERTDLASLRRAIVGGAPMPVPLLEIWREHGVEIVQGYGLTEAAPNVLCLPPEDARAQGRLRGQAVPLCRGRPLDPRASCSSAARTSSAGYWRNPEATEAAFRDGWLLTGDIAERDEEGFYRIRGRLKDMVVSGGENVYPAEIEDGARRPPGRRRGGGRGRPRRALGRGLRRVRRPAGEVGEEELRLVLPRAARRGSRCRSRSTRSTALPRNALGKVQKGDLKVPA